MATTKEPVKKESVALKLLKTNRTVKERAASFAKSIERNLQKTIIDELVAKKEKLEDNIFDLSDFSLDTNLNSGHRAMTKEECETRFIKLINSEYELELVSRELEIKQASFDKYFG